MTHSSEIQDKYVGTDMCEGLGNTVSEEEAWGLRFEILGVDAGETQGQIQYPALRSACNSSSRRSKALV